MEIYNDKYGAEKLIATEKPLNMNIKVRNRKLCTKLQIYNTHMNNDLEFTLINRGTRRKYLESTYVKVHKKYINI